jgi:hypothetical protein
VLDKLILKGGGGGGDTVEASPTLSDSCYTLAHLLVKKKNLASNPMLLLVKSDRLFLVNLLDC